MLEGIVHVECNDHADVHVDELGIRYRFRSRLPASTTFIMTSGVSSMMCFLT